MNKKPILILVLSLLLSCLLYARFNQAEVKAPNGHPVHNLNTGLNYTTIQGAIEANETLNGHTIFVEKGIYHEHVRLYGKSVSLIGENKETTIIDGKGQFPYYILHLQFVNNVTISGFTLQNSGISPCGFGQGIYLCYSYESNISNNIVSNNHEGIVLWFSDRNVVTGNIVLENSYSGIEVGCSHWNVISDNFVSDNGRGIVLYDSNKDSFIGNTVSNNIEVGIAGPYRSNNITFYHNNIINNTMQVYIGTNCYTNVWDNGVEGNFWSDYTGVDLNHDGIGDLPYFIDKDNVDHYPLMTQFIVPEFPSFLILPLFMTLTLVAILIYRRKHSV